MRFSGILLASVQGLIVLFPTYLMAWLTDQMVWTIPMLAASSFIAASLKNDTTELKVDDGDSGNNNEIEDG